MLSLANALLLSGCLLTAPPIVVGHRGTGSDRPWNPYPENTVPSLRQAFLEGADMVEIDVQLDACGVPILWHNEKVPVNGQKIPVHELRLSQMPPLVGPTGITAPVPSLRQALRTALCCKHCCRAMIVELKLYEDCRRAPLVYAVAEALLDECAVDRVIVSSLDAEALKLMECVIPGIATGYLAATVRRSGEQVAEMLGPDGQPIEWLLIRQGYGIFFYKRGQMIDRAHEKGLGIGAWTVNSRPSISRLDRRGIDLIITDRPDVARRVVGP